MTQNVRKSSVLLGALLIVVFAFSLFFRVYQLDHIPAINGDEAFPTVQMREMTWGRPVQLWVPTQRILSPIYASLVLAVQFFSPSLARINIRLPAVASGLFLLFSCYFFLSFLSKRTALLATLLIASFPMAIAYSRSAVEQSLMGVVGIVAIHFALKGLWKSTIFAFLLGLVVHPVNIFLLPILLAPLVCHLWKSQVPFRKKVLGIPFLFVVFSLALVGLLATLPPEYSYLNLLSVSKFLAHEPVNALVELGRFLLYYTRLFSGVTTFEYFANPTPDFWTEVLDLSFAMGIGSIVIVGLRTLWHEQKHLEFSFVLGLLISLLCFFIVAGPRALAPGLSRHSNYLTVPSAIAFAICLESLFGKWPRALLGSIGVFSLGLLLNFWIFYFLSIQQDGGGFTHRTYLTGVTEPKKAAFDWIAGKNPSSSQKRFILVEDWWTYWPIRYLALARQDLVVLDASTLELSQLKQHREFIAVGSPAGPFAKLLSQMEKNGEISLVDHFSAPAFGGKTALVAWQLKRSGQ